MTGIRYGVVVQHVGDVPIPRVRNVPSPNDIEDIVKFRHNDDIYASQALLVKQRCYEFHIIATADVYSSLVDTEAAALDKFH